MDDRRDRVVSLYERGQFAEAAQLALRFLDETPDDGRLLEVYGAACCNLRRFDEARPALEHASALVPLHPLAQYALATCYVLEGRHDVAGAMYEYLATRVRDTGVLSAVATRLGAMGRYQPALEVCLKIQDLDPGHHQAFFGVAYYLEQLGNPPEALIPSLSMAMDLAPNVLHYRVNLALVLDAAGRLAAGYELLATVPPERVGCPCVLRRMIDLFERAGDQGRSLTCRLRLSCLLS